MNYGLEFEFWLPRKTLQQNIPIQEIETPHLARTLLKYLPDYLFHLIIEKKDENFYEVTHYFADKKYVETYTKQWFKNASKQLIATGKTKFLFKLEKLFNKNELIDMAKKYDISIKYDLRLLEIYSGFKLLNDYFNNISFKWSAWHNTFKQKQQEYNDFFRVEYDGSLFYEHENERVDYYGIELITPKFDDYENMKNFYLKLVDFIKDHEGKVSDACGFHVNISDDIYYPFKDPRPMLEYYKERFLYDRFKRYNSLIQSVKKYTKKDAFSAIQKLLTHRNSVNIRKYALEFRIIGNENAIEPDLFFDTVEHYEKCYNIFINSKKYDEISEL